MSGFAEPLLTRDLCPLDPGRKLEQVCQKKGDEFARVGCLRRRNILVFMGRIVPKKPDAVHHGNQGRRQSVTRLKVTDPLCKCARPRRIDMPERSFDGFSIHESSIVPVPAIKSCLGLPKAGCDILWGGFDGVKSGRLRVGSREPILDVLDAWILDSLRMDVAEFTPKHEDNCTAAHSALGKNVPCMARHRVSISRVEPRPFCPADGVRAIEAEMSHV